MGVSRRFTVFVRPNVGVKLRQTDERPGREVQDGQVRLVAGVFGRLVSA